jgi:hypothetical protein
MGMNESHKMYTTHLCMWISILTQFLSFVKQKIFSILSIKNMQFYIHITCYSKVSDCTAVEISRSTDW